MVFRKSLTRELTVTSIGVFLVLFAILLTTQTINMLGRAAQGRVANEAVAALIGFWALGFFPVLLILTIFITVMVVLGRAWRDHEMAVWFSSGMSLTRWIAPVLRFTLPFTLLIIIGTSFIGPWAQYRSKEYAQNLKQREEISALAPGVFKEAQGGKRIYFIESYSPEDGASRNLFVQSIEKDEVSTIFAEQGKLSVNNKGVRELVLDNGHRYIGEAGSGEFEIGQFKRYSVRMGESPRLIEPASDSETRSTLELFAGHTASDRAELAWRLSMPLSSLILALLAIPLAYYNPRSGHAYNLVMALGAYLLYQNGLWLLRDWIAHDKISSALGILPIHLLMLGIALGLIWYRNRPTGFVAAAWNARRQQNRTKTRA
ncbi:LPS export ABC transporter permease LptF [Craterilacuibacter sinensis]|uniref:Lipopolysaccharide export system permease protein LptF n=1 Tax=Craterilacuibacter sinensis TaxID=2686017 RepID=A0A845BN73_9NEIS|nr:LPS export ABC transporter permease LptF [Craterilacuibacter sinensis]MXR37805.1 LPS export ABC transporter permease LptF [Craterilacuibacter sinensis]